MVSNLKIFSILGLSVIELNIQSHVMSDHAHSLENAVNKTMLEGHAFGGTKPPAYLMDGQPKKKFQIYPTQKKVKP